MAEVTSVGDELSRASWKVIYHIWSAAEQASMSMTLL